MRKRGKKERYIDMWRREHKEVRFYLKIEEYYILERLASKHNMTVKEFILKFINDARKAYEDGYDLALKDFVDDPYAFYFMVRERYDGDIALFEVPCSICGEPMVFHHKNEDWETEVKPTLLEAFRDWYHVRCKRKRSLRRG